MGKDLHSMVTSWNAGAENIFGYSAQEMVGGSIMRLVPPDRRRRKIRSCPAFGAENAWSILKPSVSPKTAG